MFTSINYHELRYEITVADNHAPFKSKMPAYKNDLTEKEVWQVMSYAHVFSHRHLLTHTHTDVEKVAMVGKKHHEEEPGQKEHGH